MNRKQVLRGRIQNMDRGPQTTMITETVQIVIQIVISAFMFLLISFNLQAGNNFVFKLIAADILASFTFYMYLFVMWFKHT